LFLTLQYLRNSLCQVGAYPFTTLRPQLGVLPHSDGSFTVLADIPGLIRGAHLNRGLGHEFLRYATAVALPPPWCRLDGRRRSLAAEG
jgi:GTPase involved in cell partitioning and DNA repair